MHRLNLTRGIAVAACAALLVLAACDRQAARDTGYRTGPGMIGSAALFEPARFAGDWQVVAAYGPEAACGRRAEEWRLAPQGFDISGTACAPGGLQDFAAPGRLVGPGRVQRDLPTGAEEVWVLWVDSDYRIAAIGTPDGRFGRIMARPGQARDDLMTAARDVLTFNGYDRQGLVIMGQGG